MSSYKETSHHLPSNPLDKEVNTDFIRICKCILPYLNRNAQKQLAISLKMLELVSTIQLFQDENLNDTFRTTRQDNWEDELLLNIRDNISPEKAYLIDAFIKFKEFSRILKNTKNEPTIVEDGIFEEDFSHNTPQENQEMNAFMQMFNPTAKKETTSYIPTSNDTQPSKLNKADLLNTLAPLLDDKQKQMLQALASMMQ